MINFEASLLRESHIITWTAEQHQRQVYKPNTGNYLCCGPSLRALPHLWCVGLSKHRPSCVFSPWQPYQGDITKLSPPVGGCQLNDVDLWFLRASYGTILPFWSNLQEWRPIYRFYSEHSWSITGGLYRSSAVYLSSHHSWACCHIMLKLHLLNLTWILVCLTGRLQNYESR